MMASGLRIEGRKPGRLPVPQLGATTAELVRAARASLEDTVASLRSAGLAIDRDERTTARITFTRRRCLAASRSRELRGSVQPPRWVKATIFGFPPISSASPSNSSGSGRRSPRDPVERLTLARFAALHAARPDLGYRVIREAIEVSRNTSIVTYRRMAHVVSLLPPKGQTYLSELQRCHVFRHGCMGSCATSTTGSLEGSSWLIRKDPQATRG